RPRVELRVPATVNDVLSLLQGSIGLVTMRLHPMILGAGLTPVLCLSRGVKTDAIAAELSVPVISVRSEAWSAVRARAKAFITEIASTENRERFVRASAAAAALQRARVEDYFSALRPFLPAKTGAWKAACFRTPPKTDPRASPPSCRNPLGVLPETSPCKPPRCAPRRHAGRLGRTPASDTAVRRSRS